MAIEKKSKFLGTFWSYQLNSTTNSAHLPRKWAKWAELAVLFSWYLQNGLQDFDFFQLPWVPNIHQVYIDRIRSNLTNLW